MMANLFRRHGMRMALGFVLALVLLGHSSRVQEIPLLSLLDAYIYDARLRLTMPRGVDERIVIVDIDERSLAQLGRWPWPRNRMAALTDSLFAHYQVAVAGFDVFFVEPDESSGLQQLESLASGALRNLPDFHGALAQLRGTLDYDGRFATALRDRPVVLGYYFSNQSAGHGSGALPEPVLPAGMLGGRTLAVAAWDGYGGNLPILQASAALAGHVNPLVDFDGVSRRVPLLAEYGGAHYEALSLAMLRLLLGKPEVRPGYAGGGEGYAGLEWLDLVNEQGVIRIPVDAAAAALIPYRGVQGSFPYVSAADVLERRVPLESLRGRIILVGTSTPGLMDLRATPVGQAYPGVEIHANLLAGMLDGTLRQKPAYMLGAEVLQLGLVALVLCLVLPMLSPARASLLTLGLLLAAVGLNLVLWQAGLVLPLAATLAAILLIFALNMSWGYFVESRSKRQFTELFGQYVPPELVDEMARDPERYSMAGRSAELTVLFADVRSFTSISEGMSPEALTHLMNEYLSAMTATIQSHRGTLDKYVGDLVMAFWGAPINDPGHAVHAVRAGLAMQAALRDLAPGFVARGWPELQIGIGVNTGMMTVGDMGSAVRKAYTVLGDAVNLGSRLEGLTKQYGVMMLVGESTRAQCPELGFREVDRVRVKGKEAPVAIFEPFDPVQPAPGQSDQALRLWRDALRAYREQSWDAADVLLHNLLRLAPDDRLFTVYAERISHYRKHPPGPDWDGVTAFTTK